MPDARRVLLVDDDRRILQAVGIRLRAVGYEALMATDGPTGIEAAAVHQPDAIVLDVRMPRMTGLEVLAELRKSDATRDIPVVMLSASLVDQNEAIARGARYFLQKPYDAKMLVTALDEVTGKTVQTSS